MHRTISRVLCLFAALCLFVIPASATNIDQTAPLANLSGAYAPAIGSGSDYYCNVYYQIAQSYSSSSTTAPSNSVYGDPDDGSFQFASTILEYCYCMAAKITGSDDIPQSTSTTNISPYVHLTGWWDYVTHSGSLSLSTGHILDAWTSVPYEDSVTLFDDGATAIYNVDGCSWSGRIDQAQVGTLTTAPYAPWNRSMIIQSPWSEGHGGGGDG